MKKGRAFVWNLATIHFGPLLRIKNRPWLQHTPGQRRWLEQLAEIKFQVTHWPGRKHRNVDALSHMPYHQCSCEDWGEVAAVTEVVEPVIGNGETSLPDSLEKAQGEDPDLSLVRSWLEEGGQVPDLVQIFTKTHPYANILAPTEQLYLQGGVLYHRTPDNVKQLVVPKTQREEFLRLAHMGIMGGHLGVRRMRWQVRRRAYWVEWSKDVKHFCQHCSQCTRYHWGQPPHQSSLRLSIDITGPHLRR